MFTNVGALERQLARQQDAMLQWRQKEHAKKYQVRQEGRRISIKVKGRGEGMMEMTKKEKETSQV